MSITYDPQKWTSPLRARDFEPVRKKSGSPVVVSLRELRYFKANPGKMPVSVTAFLGGDEDADSLQNPTQDAEK